jgi:hypothetical protein
LSRTLASDKKGIKLYFGDSYFEADGVHHYWERSQRVASAEVVEIPVSAGV